MIHTPTKLLRSTVLGAGLLAMMLRSLLYATATDYNGLLIAGHWTTWSILILTGLVLGILLLMTRKIQVPADYSRCFPASMVQGAGSLIAAVAIAVRSLSLYPLALDPLDQAAAISGLIAALGLLIVGICRQLGRKPSFLCHSTVSIFFALQMISQYRHWSADPQLMDYSFYMIALICLMLTTYFLAGFEADMRNPRGTLIFSMAGAFFCCVALPESGDGILLIPCALWAFTCAPQTKNADEENEHDDP